MIVIDGYALTQYPMQNLIVIALPQTMKTLTNTVGAISDRRLELTPEEEAVVLGIAKSLYEKRENDGGPDREKSCC